MKRRILALLLGTAMLALLLGGCTININTPGVPTENTAASGTEATVSTTAASDVPAPSDTSAPSEEPAASCEPYASYYRICEERRQTYGDGLMIEDDPSKPMQGLFLVDLKDLDRDGVEELILAYASEGYAYSSDHYVWELWRWNGTKAEQVYVSGCFNKVSGINTRPTVRFTESYYADVNYIVESELGTRDLGSSVYRLLWLQNGKMQSKTLERVPCISNEDLKTFSVRDSLGQEWIPSYCVDEAYHTNVVCDDEPKDCIMISFNELIEQPWAEAYASLCQTDPENRTLYVYLDDMPVGSFSVQDGDAPVEVLIRDVSPMLGANAYWFAEQFSVQLGSFTMTDLEGTTWFTEEGLASVGEIYYGTDGIVSADLHLTKAGVDALNTAKQGMIRFSHDDQFLIGRCWGEPIGVVFTEDLVGSDTVQLKITDRYLEAAMTCRLFAFWINQSAHSFERQYVDDVLILQEEENPERDQLLRIVADGQSFIALYGSVPSVTERDTVEIAVLDYTLATMDRLARAANGG